MWIFAVDKMYLFQQVCRETGNGTVHPLQEWAHCQGNAPHPQTKPCSSCLKNIALLFLGEIFLYTKVFFSLIKSLPFLALKGPSHQFRFAQKWHCWKGLGATCNAELLHILVLFFNCGLGSVDTSRLLISTFRSPIFFPHSQSESALHSFLVFKIVWCVTPPSFQWWRKKI